MRIFCNPEPGDDYHQFFAELKDMLFDLVTDGEITAVLVLPDEEPLVWVRDLDKGSP